MSLRFYFGASGAGKSTQLYEEVTQRAAANPKQRFFVVVPDQFTMQTQKELVERHPAGGIMNIDVLSFGRLSHRIFEETGGFEMPVLDDTGKSLVLQKVARNLSKELPVIGGNLHKLGFIHEVKSAVSEFMQYGVEEEGMEKLLSYARSKGALYYKLKDLSVLYRGFQEYIKERFATTEETLSILQKKLPDSRLIRDSIVVFDGFTGFTPIQNRVIQELLRLCREVVVTVLIEEKENPFVPDEPQKLFYLSQKTVQTLEKLAAQAGVSRGRDVRLPENPCIRFRHNPELQHLERSLFRPGAAGYAGQCKKIRLIETANPREEARRTALSIRRLVREEGCCYRDIAVVVGDLKTYEDYVEEEFAKFGIPMFLDRTRGILLNPFIEYIRSALKAVEQNYSYETMFHFLKSGLCGLQEQQLDELENYVLAAGIRGRRVWNSIFTRKSREMGQDNQQRKLERLNLTREEVVRQLEPLTVRCRTMREHVEALYLFLTQNDTQKKLKDYESRFQEAGELAKAKEYAQIYRLVMELLDQLVSLLGEEEMGRKEFAEILDAGFAEIEVGTIPQSVDKVVVGDIERSRLNQVRSLFFLGVNDGNIPKSGGSGGILSDLDREFLAECEIELAPTPRQKMYTQRLYLYMNMTKPSDMLTLSYSRSTSGGKARKPSYLIGTLQKLFPELAIERPDMDMTEMSLSEKLQQAEAPQDTLRLFVDMLRDYAAGQLKEKEEPAFFVLYDNYRRQEEYAPLTELLTRQAFLRYESVPLGRETARLLYGQVLQNSVSRLERFAACAYAHFLQYGLTLQEREEYSFEDVDMGNVFHGVLEQFSNRLEEEGSTWFAFSREEGERYVEEALERYAVQYGETVLFSSARNAYAVKRMERILKRTVDTLQYQLKKGAFTPQDFEVSFSALEELDAVNIALSDREKMRLRGRIDRIDTAREGDKLYVKVIDYKSGSKSFDLVSLYYGLQLQLVVYLNAAVAMKKRENPQMEVVPAAVLYYHVADPMLKGDGQKLSAEAVNEQLKAQLRMNGAVNGEDTVVHLLDAGFESKSDVIPVERKKDGSYSARSAVYGREDLRQISDYVTGKMRQLGNQIIAGDISVNPYEKGQESACTYCSFQSVCGYDTKIEGYHKRTLSMGRDEAMEAIRQPGREAPESEETGQEAPEQEAPGREARQDG